MLYDGFIPFCFQSGKALLGHPVRWCWSRAIQQTAGRFPKPVFFYCSHYLADYRWILPRKLGPRSPSLSRRRDTCTAPTTIATLSRLNGKEFLDRERRSTLQYSFSCFTRDILFASETCGSDKVCPQSKQTNWNNRGNYPDAKRTGEVSKRLSASGRPSANLYKDQVKRLPANYLAESLPLHPRKAL